MQTKAPTRINNPEKRPGCDFYLYPNGAVQKIEQQLYVTSACPPRGTLMPRHWDIRHGSSATTNLPQTLILTLGCYCTHNLPGMRERTCFRNCNGYAYRWL